MADAPRATRAVVSDPPGQPTTVTLYASDGTALAELSAGPHYWLDLAHQLLGAALRRMGRGLRPPTEETGA